MDSENSSTNKLLGKRICLLNDTKGFDNPDLAGTETIIMAGSNCLLIRVFLNKNKTIIAQLLCPDGNQYYIRNQYDQLESFDVVQIKQTATLQLLLRLNDYLKTNKKNGKDLLIQSIDTESRHEIMGAIKMIDTLNDVLVQVAELHKVKDAYLRQTGEPKK